MWTWTQQPSNWRRQNLPRQKKTKTAKGLQRSVVDRAKALTATAKPPASAPTSDGANRTLTIGPKANPKKRKIANRRSTAIARTSATPIATPMQSSDATTDVARAMAETAAIRTQGAAPTRATADKVKARLGSEAGIDHRSGAAERIQAMLNRVVIQ